MSAAAPLTNAIVLALASVVGLGSILSRFATGARVPHSDPVVDDRATLQQVVPSGRVGRVGRVGTRSVGLAVLLTVVWMVGPLLCLALGTAMAGWVRGLPIAQQRRRLRQRVRAVPEALDLVVVLLRAGATPRQTLIELGRRGPPSTQAGFAAVALQLDRGQPFSSAIGALRMELGDAITPFVELLAASERYGLSTSHLVQQLSNETRALRRRHDEAAARMLPVKLSFPLVMCTLPSFVLLAIAPAVLAALSSLGANSW